MKSIQKKVLGFLTVLLVLQGCVSDKSLVDSHLVEAWHLSGKIGIAYPSKNCSRDYCPPHSAQGNLAWQQKKSAYDIELSDPFDRVVMTVAGDQQRLLAKMPGKPPVSATPSELMSLLIGNNEQKAAFLQLGPQDLQYWVTGRPVPKVAHEKKSESDFEQKGFTISSRQWRKTPVGNMPALVTIHQGDFKVRLVIREWQKIAP